MSTLGPRGTDDLSPEQRPGLRKMRGRAQPYRKRRDRLPGPTLQAMIEGSPAFMRNPADFRRARERAFWRLYD